MPILFQRFREALRGSRENRGSTPNKGPISLRWWLPVDAAPPGDRPVRTIPPEWQRIPRRLWKYQPKPRRVLLGRPPESVADLVLLVRLEDSELGRHRVAGPAISSGLAHLALALFILSRPVGQISQEDLQLALRYNDPTRLVAPPPTVVRELAGAPPTVTEMNLEGLLAEPGAAPEQAKEPEPFVPPAPAPVPVPAPAIVEPPALETVERAEATPVPGPTPSALTAAVSEPPPESAAAEEKPRIAFEPVTPGAFSRSGHSSSAGAGGTIPRRPRSSVQEAIREVARAGGGGHGLVIGDIDSREGYQSQGLPPSRDNTGSAVELLSDPQGVDFRPYLIHVLASVRRNWYAVMPASAKLGLRGRVNIQFSIDRAGNVPKLVIALPSGSDPLDRAAVAAISASNPFPPLPGDYRSRQVRLQLNFLYNLKRSSLQ